MIVNYQLAGSPHYVDIAAEDDLSSLCREVEDRLRQLHPELADAPYLSERIAEGMLNGPAAEETDVDLGPLP
jgi:hypothetical protein